MSDKTMIARVIFVIVFAVVSHVHSQNCNGIEDTCTQSLRSVLTSRDFWFGNTYRSACSDEGQRKNFACINPDTRHRTIISRILQADYYDPSSVSQLLHVRFYVPAGSYRACGHKFDVPAVYMDADLNQTEVSYLDSWCTQKRPAITWDPESGVVYTLAAYNVDLLQLAGLWVNIKGGDSALGSELYPYRGPLATLNRTSIHAFVLYKQTEAIKISLFDSITKTLEYVRKSGETYLLNKQSELFDQILDPVGIGLISVGADPFGIEKHKSLVLHNNCPWLIARMRPLLKRLVDVHGLTDLGADVSNLEVEVEVRYTSEAIKYSSCCKNRSSSARVIQIDALSQNTINPVYLRSQPFVKFTAVNMLDSIYFFDKLYTILLLDVTLAATIGSRQTSLLWQVTDIQGLYLTSGLTQKNYSMPLPPLERTEYSLYTFFVFRQNDTIGKYAMENYCDSSRIRGSDCDFNLYKFVQDYKLDLSGVNWFWSQPDLYSRMKLYETDNTKIDSACAGVSGYGQPCPDKCAPSMTTKSMTAAPEKVTTTPAGNTVRISANCFLVLMVTICIICVNFINDIMS